MNQKNKIALKEIQSGLGWFVCVWGVLTVLVIIIQQFFVV